MKGLKIVRNVGVLIFCVMMTAGIFLLGQGFVKTREALSREPLEEKLESIRSDPGFVTLDEMPEIYSKAVIAVEDHRFYRHPGIDFLSIGRALLHDLKTMSLEEGGSTITQQVAKNLYFSQKKELERKAAEVWMALYLERHLTKEEILELYVNTIYFGEGYYGIREAAKGYFGKEPCKLDEGEATLLAGVPNAPSAYAPSRHPELALRRQQQVLNCMVEYGFLEKSETTRMIWQGKLSKDSKK